MHYVEQFTEEVRVCKNNEIELHEVAEFSHILISPGPGLPANAGITLKVIETYAPHKPILGVCLGCQAIAEYFGGALYNQPKVAHGVQRKVQKTIDNWPLLKDLNSPFKVGLYHSWAVQSKDLPACLEVTAQTEEGVIMGIQHKEYPLAGLQFHPESIMTDNGISIIENWLKQSIVGNHPLL